MGDSGRHIVVPLLTLMAVGLTKALMSVQVPPGARLLLVLGFLLVFPGLPIVRLIEVGDREIQLALILGVSIVLDVLAPTILIYAGLWSPVAALNTLIVIAAAGAVALLARQLPVSTPVVGRSILRTVLGWLLLADRRVIKPWRDKLTPVPAGEPRSVSRSVIGHSVAQVDASRPRRANSALAPRTNPAEVGASRSYGSFLGLEAWLVTLMTGAAWLIPTSYLLASLADDRLSAALSLDLSLMVGMVLGGCRIRGAARPILVAGLSLCLSALAWRSLDGNLSAPEQIVAQFVNIWGPAIIGAAVASVTNPIAAQISAWLSATTRASSRQSDRTPTTEQRRGRRSQRRVAEDKAGGGPLHNDSPSTADFDAESQEAHTQRSAPA